MPKKITDRQRIITYAMNATEQELQDAIETFKAIQSSRFPKKQVRTKKPESVAAASGGD